ncbi:MAG: hypothetical protein RMI34_00515 [Chloroherpetonaceae bacterium]|nr:hypothetical protein [Chloroherpetonaceae bacterium]MCS7211051.1 hypothetical protein [Chloroherpetonaceae bacterium]MDW8018541.1 hypothetical protein [Chloroherpetonaceae bacterium]MDW8467363.1 hypothetical protein [Chloroherpetonaceae bacterium]
MHEKSYLNPQAGRQMLHCLPVEETDTPQNSLDDLGKQRSS